jgi:hypothetical protein
MQPDLLLPLFKRCMRWVVVLFLIYAVVRLTIVVGIPKLYPREEFAQQLMAVCARETAICVESQSFPNVIGRWWGIAVVMKVKPGKVKELKNIIRRDVIPADAEGRWGPWEFVGFKIEEMDPLEYEFEQKKSNAEKAAKTKDSR